jgi:hypothetical protein
MPLIQLSAMQKQKSANISEQAVSEPQKRLWEVFEMTIDGNKAIIRKFVTEVLGGGNIDLIDQLLAPSYVNPSLGVTDSGWLQSGDFQLESCCAGTRF